MHNGYRTDYGPKPAGEHVTIIPPFAPASTTVVYTIEELVCLDKPPLWFGWDVQWPFCRIFFSLLRRDADILLYRIQKRDFISLILLYVYTYIYIYSIYIYYLILYTYAWAKKVPVQHIRVLLFLILNWVTLAN